MIRHSNNCNNEHPVIRNQYCFCSVFMVHRTSQN